MTDAHDGITLLDPVYAALVSELPAFHLSDETVVAMREQIAGMAPPFAPSGKVRHEDLTVASVDGQDIVLRIYTPEGRTGARPCVYAIHGGGYVMGTYEMLDRVMDEWCATLGIVGVSVEYRLAPEAAYPIPLEDCYAGLAWVHAHAADLGIDPDRIGIQGTSAGGGLAAALALLARDRGEIPIAFQVLECPMIDDRLHTASSNIHNLQVWSREANVYGWRAYLGDRHGTDDVPYTAAPARCEDLSGLPPAIVCVGGADGFRDEDVLYALALMRAGVSTELHVYPGAPHGAHIVPHAPAAQQWVRDVDDWVARQVAD
ncbi:MAG: alpha/beta hydrolase [Actinobacteria bacterium]|nr:alpha/beta hydrolase [Actinomycetota bacterium]